MPITGALAYFGVGECAKEHAAPIGASPGVRVIEALVARLRQTFGETFHQVVPYALRRKIPRLDPGNRLHVGRESFFDPVMLSINRWERQVHHLVGHYPVALEVLFGR